MIALCAEHHRKADAGAFTREQLLEIKASASRMSNIVSGRFDWMRRDLLAIVGGTLYHQVRTILQYRNHPVIWFNRDEAGHLLLNARMLTNTRQRRMWIDDHGWVLHGDAEDVECPPNGKLLSVKYPNGDAVRVEFYEIDSAEEIRRHFYESVVAPDGLEMRFPVPITACEIHYRVGGTQIRFGPRETTLPGLSMVRGFVSGSPIGIRFG